MYNYNKNFNSILKSFITGTVLMVRKKTHLKKPFSVTIFKVLD